MKRSYICQIRVKNRPSISMEFEGIAAVKDFLRSENVSFGDDRLSRIGGDVVELKRGEDEFDIELLPDCCCEITVDGVVYLPFQFYRKKYKQTKGSLQYAVKKGWVASIFKDGCRYIEDKEIEHR